MTRVIHYICNIKNKDFLLCQHVMDLLGLYIDLRLRLRSI